MTDKNKPTNTPKPDPFSKRGGKVPTGKPAGGLRRPRGGGSQKVQRESSDQREEVEVAAATGPAEATEGTDRT
ncbi:MAG: hypothetical protein ACRDT0_21320 [Pseudonocardiaceae bacterium]